MVDNNNNYSNVKNHLEHVKELTDEVSTISSGITKVLVDYYEQKLEEKDNKYHPMQHMIVLSSAVNTVQFQLLCNIAMMARNMEAQDIAELGQEVPSNDVKQIMCSEKMKDLLKTLVDDLDRPKIVKILSAVEDFIDEEVLSKYPTMRVK